MCVYGQGIHLSNFDKPLNIKKGVWILNSQVFVIIVEKMTFGKENASTQKAMPQESYKIWIRIQVGIWILVP